MALFDFDLSSAFDAVDHVTLLSLLSQQFAVTVQALAWLQSYLRGES